MTDEEWEKIRPQAERLEQARTKLNAAQSRNTSSDPRTAIEQYVALKRFELELQQAKINLEGAVRDVLGVTP